MKRELRYFLLLFLFSIRVIFAPAYFILAEGRSHDIYSVTSPAHRAHSRKRRTSDSEDSRSFIITSIIVVNARLAKKRKLSLRKLFSLFAFDFETSLVKNLIPSYLSNWLENLYLRNSVFRI